MSSGVNKAFAVLLLLFGVTVMAAFQGPKDPVMPQDPAGKSASSSSASTAVAGDPFPVELVFADGKRLQGTVKIKYTELHTKFTHDGFVYYKKIQIKDLQSIVIQQWQGKKGGGSLYYFFPSVYQLHTKAGAVIPMTRRMPMFDKIPLDNRYGTTTVYSYFADYWEGNRWKNAGTGPFAFREKNPHGRTVVRINFK